MRANAETHRRGTGKMRMQMSIPFLFTCGTQVEQPCDLLWGEQFAIFSPHYYGVCREIQFGVGSSNYFCLLRFLDHTTAIVILFVCGEAQTMELSKLLYRLCTLTTPEGAVWVYSVLYTLAVY